MLLYLALHILKICTPKTSLCGHAAVLHKRRVNHNKEENKQGNKKSRNQEIKNKKAEYNKALMPRVDSPNSGILFSLVIVVPNRQKHLRVHPSKWPFQLLRFAQFVTAPVFGTKLRSAHLWLQFSCM